jgi:hypothetical protein
MIGERTRYALAAAKARRIKRGNPKQAEINRAKAAWLKATWSQSTQSRSLSLRALKRSTHFLEQSGVRHE